MTKYTYHLISTAWRKKSSVLFIAITLVLIIMGLHYTRSDVKPIVENIEQELLSAKSVEFVGLDRLNNEDSKLDLMEKDNYVMIPKKEQVFSNRLAQKETEQPLETDQQLGIPFVNSHNPYVPKQRIVHLDLKGAPPLIPYYKRFFPFIKNLGATGLLIEYEDMFPYRGMLKNISATNSYSNAQIVEILNLAKDFHLEVIPLIQTFGHLEFALKLEEFSNLREVPGSPQALCPNRIGTLDFIQEMIDQVMDLHPNAKHLHIGCDEVYQMGECEICRSQLRETLFLMHVRHVSKMIHKKYPHLKIIIWDDMLRHISQQTMLEVNLGKLVEPMVWVYAEDVYRFIQPQVWDKYAGIFPRVWAASAFKGAFGESLYVSDAKRHLENNLRWLDLMSHQSVDFREGFVGLVLTGWQRYDHFAILCELLPAGAPSLALSLTAVTHGYFNASLKTIFLSGLSCPRESSNSPFIALDYDPFLWDKSRCLFPGSPVFELIYRFHNAETETKEFIKQIKEQRGWLTDYNSRRNFSSPLRLEEMTSDLPRLYFNMLSIVKASFEAMENIYDNFTISEWIEQRIYTYIVQLEQIEKESTAMKDMKVWPVRPLPILPDMKRLLNGV